LSQTKLFDPFTMWKDIYAKTEATWSEALQESMKKEPFSEGMGQTLNNHLQYQELVTKMTEAYLKQVNMPSRGEIASIASLIINVDEKVDRLEDKIEEEALKNDMGKEVGQLRRAITNLDKKLDKVLEAFDEISRNKLAEAIKEKN
jgi:polyhydroxyalkanoic acid synthase PhaR subunit